MIHLSLSDKIINIWRDISVENLNREDGLKLMIDELEKLHVKDTKASAYFAYEKSESSQRPLEMNIIDDLNV